MSHKHFPSSSLVEGDSTIQEPEEVQTMLKLASRGWGSKRIAQELGCSRTTVKRYLRLGGWTPYQGPGRQGQLCGQEDWLREQFMKHAGNADVVRQELKSVHGIKVSLRTVERAVSHLRKELRVEKLATVRYETPPGRQLQIDFGSKSVKIDGDLQRVHVFVATLGYSRRVYAVAFTHERQSAWFQGLEGAFRHFNGVTDEVLVDNAQALVKHHNRRTGELIFNERFKGFAKFWGFIPRACAPFRARTKGKDERGVGYVKSNALAGHEFSSFEHLASHLARWAREVADVRSHGTTGEAPLQRFERDERGALATIGGRGTYLQVREVARQVANDSFVDFDTNRYSVPWRLIGERVTVAAEENTLQVTHAGQLVACHPLSSGRHDFVRDPEHFVGILQPHRPTVVDEPPRIVSGLLRPLSEYEALSGGGW